MKRNQKSTIYNLKSLALAFGFALVTAESALALPPLEDVPEEMLRTEIITGARSPLDGKPLTATEYAQLRAELAKAPPEKIVLAPVIRKQIRLLRLRKFIKTFFPFIPIR
ncbi:hypothetical protein K9N68_11660 [Kovacikia minuta CCNUW1]|uniref:hypothetical protein n=1 Tax=Kovacikia minuta TaxID=2931930 RepID=UPI001CCBF938|nr:hypothetical protein [Kovacikia minuta]UBF28465.1 hypothetical protein K9N68_11660 [Kovacikia minuta CCNUW1]